MCAVFNRNRFHGEGVVGNNLVGRADVDFGHGHIKLAVFVKSHCIYDVILRSVKVAESPCVRAFFGRHLVYGNPIHVECLGTGLEEIYDGFEHFFIAGITRSFDYIGIPIYVVFGRYAFDSNDFGTYICSRQVDVRSFNRAVDTADEIERKYDFIVGVAECVVGVPAGIARSAFGNGDGICTVINRLV